MVLFLWYFLVFVFLFVFLAHSNAQGYYKVCAQRLHLVIFRVLENKPGLAACKGSTLPTLLSLWYINI